MDADADFTFSQVRPPVEDIGVNGQSYLPDVSGITIKDDESLIGDGSGKIFLNNGVIKKQETVGSLSFNVIETSPANRSSDLPRKFASEDTSSSSNFSQERKVAVKKPAPRAKVPFQIGYSQMDWLKLTRTHPDLAGLKGQSNRRLISLNEVKQNQTEDAMWTVLKGRVYNLSPYMKFHPGGVDMLKKAVGKDCTSLFNKYHAWVNAEFMLEKCLVGMLDDSH